MKTEELILLIDILDKLGYNTEGAGANTIFQRLAQIAGYTDQVEGYVDTLESNLGTTGDAANASGTVLARLAELLTNRLTVARAGYLDTAITSRAPASTALSTATWTTARAAKLDNALLDTIWTAARAGKLDNLDNLNVPISSLQKPRGVMSLGSFSTSQTAYQTALSISGKGKLKALDVIPPGSATAYLKVTADGIVVHTSRISTSNTYPSPGWLFINSESVESESNPTNDGGNPRNAELSFDTSLLIQLRVASGTGTVQFSYEKED